MKDATIAVTNDKREAEKATLMLIRSKKYVYFVDDDHISGVWFMETLDKDVKHCLSLSFREDYSRPVKYTVNADTDLQAVVVRKEFDKYYEGENK